MPIVEIRHRWTDRVIYTADCGTLREAVLGAVAEGANLSGANLRAADLSAADLSEAELRGADLSAADLRGADLRAANLSEANLHAANLSEANLHAANLSEADLHAANLSEADLREANLRGANLSEANLRGANLSEANLTPIRDDIWAVLSASPAEVPGLREAIVAGRVDGTAYEGDCACLVGTLANARHCHYTQIPGLTPNAWRPAESFFLCIQKGSTPKNSQHAKLAVEWIDEWLDRMRAAFGPREEVSA